MKVLLLVLLLGGCACKPPVIIEVPIAVACKTETPKVPDYCFKSLSVDDTLFDKTKCLLSDRVRGLAYENLLVTSLESCK
jgi:hypothetical protein